jgi:hypothetical protein
VSVAKEERGRESGVLMDVTAKVASIIPASDFGLDDMTESMDLLILINGIDGRSGRDDR